MVELKLAAPNRAGVYRATMLLMPLRSDFGDINRVIGCTSGDGDLFAAAARLRHRGRGGDAGRAEPGRRAEATLPGFAEAQADFGAASGPEAALDRGQPERPGQAATAQPASSASSTANTAVAVPTQAAAVIAARRPRHPSRAKDSYWQEPRQSRAPQQPGREKCADRPLNTLPFGQRPARSSGGRAGASCPPRPALATRRQSRHSRRDSLQRQERRQVRPLEPRVRRRRQRRLGVVGDPEPAARTMSRSFAPSPTASAASGPIRRRGRLPAAPRAWPRRPRIGRPTSPVSARRRRPACSPGGSRTPPPPRPAR